MIHLPFVITSSSDSLQLLASQGRAISPVCGALQVWILLDVACAVASNWSRRKPQAQNRVPEAILGQQRAGFAAAHPVPHKEVSEAMFVRGVRKADEVTHSTKRGRRRTRASSKTCNKRGINVVYVKAQIQSNACSQGCS